MRPGYARNYLIPQSKAIPATTENLAEFEKRRADLERAQTDTLAKAQARAAQLQEMTVVVTSRVGLEGKLFGSVSSADIVQALNSAGVELHKQEVRLPSGPIRLVGNYDVQIHLHSDVDTVVRVEVIAES